ncbi:hypothetical protein N790_02605 [Arenimonas malthae CC-JY-1]|uniref:Glycosyltransferase subfamily 4-like N-terminal domain-containing protein n=1 Tax=Arenimonas malthae CC-JY-1 TaxID=1384054 RepID=A0A091AVI6_9GAMM|nr:glycosyltransferase family 4 protein [Arenimonas malthae]KFN43277.1 hypothetical protein N790_02605 [Arenimonas malthae CC-JY-1]
MRVLMVCKRQYTGRDLLDDRYGRLHEIPAGLAALGHEVLVVAASYRRSGAVDRFADGVHWLGVDVLPWPGALFAAWRGAARTFRPDVIVASSDALHLVAGERFARRLALPVVLDLYDDYESFGLTRLPGLRAALRSACTRADALVAVSRALAALLVERGVAVDRITVIGNGVPVQFAPDLSRDQARMALGLPGGVPLVGTAGALSFGRGIDDLFSAFERLQSSRPGVRLVLAGPCDRDVGAAIPRGTLDLGHRPHPEVGLVFRALDVGVVCNRDDAFARACHPMKLVEMAACGLPLVAADIGEVSRLLADRPDARYVAGDAGMLALRIGAQLDSPAPVDPGLAEPWTSLAERFAAVLDATVGAHH